MTWSAEATVKSAYKILGVAEDADREAIRAAYIELVKLNHPDLHGANHGATERLKEINHAFNLLKDSARRSGYGPAGRELQVLARRRRWPAVMLGVACGMLATSASMVIAPNFWKQQIEVPDFDPPVVAPPVVADTPSPIETLASVAASLPRQAERTPNVAAAQPKPDPAASSTTVDLPNTAPDPSPSPSPSLSADDPITSPEAVETAPGKVAEAHPDAPAGTVSPAPLRPTQRRAVEPASLSQPSVRRVAALDKWTTFRNDHFGFKISYPPDFEIGAGKQDSFRRLLVSVDGRAHLVISSGYVPETMTIASYRSELMRGPYRGARLDYAPLRETWFVLSGDLGSRAFYERVTIACDGETFHGFRLDYPAAERRYYSQVIEIMHAGYKHARGVGLHCEW